METLGASTSLGRRGAMTCPVSFSKSVVASASDGRRRDGNAEGRGRRVTNIRREETARRERDMINRYIRMLGCSTAVLVAAPTMAQTATQAPATVPQSLKDSGTAVGEIGRASCRERVCQYV